MRRGFVVLVLLAMMVGLKALKAESPGGADPLTLAAIGFVVLAAFAIAELGTKLQLPKVTGYIVSGVVLVRPDFHVFGSAPSKVIGPHGVLVGVGSGVLVGVGVGPTPDRQLRLLSPSSNRSQLMKSPSISLTI